MTAAAQPNEDGALIPALAALEDAIHALTEPKIEYLDSKVLTTPSAYMQLMDSVAGEQSNSGGGGGSKSRIPFWVDAFKLLDEIDTALSIWQPAYTGVPATVGRFHWILQRKWRPQDVHGIEQITKAATVWARQIDDLLNPPKRWTLPYPCPNCGAEHVYRPDSTGEPVRSRALLLTAEGCRCGKCQAFWPNGKFLFLGRLLGSLPDNVGGE